MKQALSLIGVSFLSVVSSLAADKKPNIILILADDMRASGMNFLGKEQVQTPNLDKLAGESTVFTNAHIMGGTSGAVSMPSRAMLMTGKYLYNLEKQGATIPNSHTMIGETLQKAGYNTFHTGKWHSSYEALNRCFKEGKAIFFGGMWDHWNVPLYDYHADMNYGKRRPVIHNQAKSNKVEYEIGEYMYSGKHSVDIFTHEAVEYIELCDSRRVQYRLCSCQLPDEGNEILHGSRRDGDLCHGFCPGTGAALKLLCYLPSALKYFQPSDVFPLSKGQCGTCENVRLCRRGAVPDRRNRTDY